MLKTNSRLLSLAIATLFFMAWANAQELATVHHTQPPRGDDTALLLQKYREASALTTQERKHLFNVVSETDRNRLWKLHLALYLVKHPKLNAKQKQVILDAFSLVRPESFTRGNNGASRPAKDNDSFQALEQRAFNAFPKNEATEIFANIGGKIQDDLLQKYQDISALSMKERKAAFRRTSVREKSDLWKTHMALYLVKRPELNETQRETHCGRHLSSSVSMV